MMQKIVKAHQLGVTLLEMLVTLLILSIGLLGVAALQSRGQQVSVASYVRTQATMLGNDIMEQIVVNREFAKNDVIDNGTGIGFGYVSKSPSDSELDNPGTIPKLKYCDLNECTDTELRDYDLIRWYFHLKKALPGGKGAIKAERIPEPPNGNLSDQVRYTIHVEWDLRDVEREGDDEATKKITWVVQI